MAFSLSLGGASQAVLPRALCRFVPQLPVSVAPPTSHIPFKMSRSSSLATRKTPSEPRLTRLVASVSPLSRCVIVSEVKPYRGHSKDIASHLVVALPRLAASDGIATCLVLVSPIHVPALEALLIYEVPWTKLPTLALHTSPSLPLSGTPTPSHTSLALADNDVLIHSPPAFDHAHSLFQGRASSRLVLPGPCPSTPRLLRIAHITCPFQDVKIMAHPLPLSLATHKTPLGITRSVALTVGGFVLSQRPVAIVYPSYLCVLIPEVWPYHGYSKDQVRRSRLVIPPALVSFPPPVSLPLRTRPSSLPSVTPAGYPPPTNSHGLGSVHHAPVLEQERRFGDVRLTPSRLATPSDIGSS
ncbi:hypothetical protein EDB89DRAFT_2069532 [Lactarius sanguifluus]|nr:hypothetical protein EDB89DRAFT_2069532 [Lactarius sanguifluus]